MTLFVPQVFSRSHQPLSGVLTLRRVRFYMTVSALRSSFSFMRHLIKFCSAAVKSVVPTTPVPEHGDDLESSPSAVARQGEDRGCLPIAFCHYLPLLSRK